MNHQELNKKYYQQAVNSAQFLAKEVQQEFIDESRARHQFEQQAILQNLQKMPVKRPLVYPVLGLFLGLVVIAAGIYSQSGRFQQTQEGQNAHQSFQMQQADLEVHQRNDSYIVNLQNRLRANPNDGDLWYELGQAYALNNEFESALICYENAHQILGDKAAIFSAMATADYYRNRQQITPLAQSWLDFALEQDPKDTASLLLLAADKFLQNDFASAIQYWRTVLDSDNESINRRTLIQSIGMAEQMMMAEQNR